MQPPPRGCVLKPLNFRLACLILEAAASARLCVETISRSSLPFFWQAAASARLCVETLYAKKIIIKSITQPPPRGCVLKLFCEKNPPFQPFAAASARLCVETAYMVGRTHEESSSRLRAAVC